jgi:hypothetical protein
MESLHFVEVFCSIKKSLEANCLKQSFVNISYVSSNIYSVIEQIYFVKFLPACIYSQNLYNRFFILDATVLNMS